MKKIPINCNSGGVSPTITAVYYKKGVYNFLKENCLDYGTHGKHAEPAVIEVDTDR